MSKIKVFCFGFGQVAQYFVRKILKENKEVYFSCQNGCLNLAKAFDRRKMADEMRKYILEIL